ncbi:MAG TPA: hypothetical protein VLF43_05540 [Candidatus Saccharimonadales bacterium]|nr:hypothetical protein [Candidatus Saccharimonadales bacterium]
MSRHPFLPGFVKALPQHHALVYSDVRPDFDDPSFGNPYKIHRVSAERVLSIARPIAHALGQTTIRPMPPIGESFESAAEGWSALRSTVGRWLGEHITRMPVPPQKHQSEHDSLQGILAAASDGALTNVAYLEAIPKKLFRRDFDDPNAAIAGWARSSAGFVSEWAGLGGKTDDALVYALARPKPTNPDNVFHDLHFDPKWFAAYDDTRQVTLDPEKVEKLVDADGHRVIYVHDRHKIPFGCAGMRLIPYMHAQLTVRAAAAGLFGQTYQEMRANHGYPEAWGKV